VDTEFSKIRGRGFWRNLRALVRRELIVSGDLAFVRLRVTLPPEREFDRTLLEWIEESRGEIEVESSEAAKRFLGPGVEVKVVSIGPGSIEIIAAVVAAYYLISNYKSFAESLQLLVRQIRHILARILGRRRVPTPPIVTVEWSPGPALPPYLVEESVRILDSNASLLLLCYLVISHAILLFALIWIIIR